MNKPAHRRDLHVIAARCRVSGSARHRVRIRTHGAVLDDDRGVDWREIRVILRAVWRILP
ncbi:MAG TPA: hypothetical protein VK601_29505 [Kofleriaceae bacterium]|nr:hypothetical protein [Kofleriaceae bacterium]